MTVSLYGVWGRRSPSQSKYGLITTPSVMWAAESASLRLSGSPKE